MKLSRSIRIPKIKKTIDKEVSTEQLYQLYGLRPEVLLHKMLTNGVDEFLTVPTVYHKNEKDSTAKQLLNELEQYCLIVRLPNDCYYITNHFKHLFYNKKQISDKQRRCVYMIINKIDIEDSMVLDYGRMTSEQGYNFIEDWLKLCKEYSFNTKTFRESYDLLEKESFIDWIKENKKLTIIDSYKKVLLIECNPIS